MTDTAPTLESLVDTAHGISRSKGFWDEYNLAVEQHDIPKLNALVNEKLLLTVSELTEAMEELRSGHTPWEIYQGDKGKPEGFGVEIADALIRILDLCGGLGIQLQDITLNKMKFNKDSRGHMHGRKF